MENKDPKEEIEQLVEEPQSNASDEGMENNNEEVGNEDINNEQLNDDQHAKIIEELTTQLQEEENKHLRLLADFENFKRRTALDKEALQKYRAQNVMTNLIPVLDNFALALNIEAKTDEVRTMMTGMEMIYRSLVQALESEGLVEIDALDKEFDPNFHQAVMTGSDKEKPSGIVLEEMQKGYMLKDRVLRPSMVKVNE